MPIWVRRLYHFCRRSRAQRSLLLQAVLLLIGVRAALSVLPFLRVRRLLDRDIDSPATAAAVPRESVIETVHAAARHVPRTGCLTQALVLRFLLARHGYAAHIRIGVARGDDGKLRAHAWVESGTTTTECGTQDVSRDWQGAALDFRL